MDNLAYILYAQSPALFLAAAALLLLCLFQHKKHRVWAVIELILGILSIVGGLFLYYLGMLYEHFTIHDFWHIRIPGWIGLVLMAALILFCSYRSIANRIRKRRAEKAAAAVEKKHAQQLEDAKNSAYAAGRADAAAKETVSSTVTAAVNAETSAPAENPQ